MKAERAALIRDLRLHALHGGTVARASGSRWADCDLLLEAADVIAAAGDAVGDSPQFRYLCTKGHHSTSVSPDIVECECPVHDDGVRPYVTTGSLDGVARCGGRLSRYQWPDDIYDVEDLLAEVHRFRSVVDIRPDALAVAAQAIVPHVEDCLRYLSSENYRVYREVWDATRKALTDLQRALAGRDSSGAVPSGAVLAKSTSPATTPAPDARQEIEFVRSALAWCVGYLQGEGVVLPNDVLRAAVPTEEEA